MMKYDKYRITYQKNHYALHDLEGIPVKDKTRLDNGGFVFTALLDEKKTRKLQSFKKYRPKLETLGSKESKKDYYVIYCDAGVFNHGFSLENGGCNKSFACASTIILKNNGEEVYRESKIIDTVATSNEMEVFAALLGLRFMVRTFTDRLDTINIIINTDSEFLFNSIVDSKITTQNILKSIRKTDESLEWSSNMTAFLTELSFLVNNPSINIYGAWIKSHKRKNSQEYTYNNIVDCMCNILINKYLDELDLDDAKRRDINQKFISFLESEAEDTIL